jgi:hypothetical protein
VFHGVAQSVIVVAAYLVKNNYVEKKSEEKEQITKLFLNR